MMSVRDRANLQFLLTASPEVLREWYDTVEEDDIIYAMQLLDRYSVELDVKHMEFEESVEIDLDMTEAQSIIQRIKDAA